MVSEDITELELGNERILGIGVTIISFGFTLGLKESISEIFLILPLLIFCLLFYSLYKYTTIMTLGGYKKFLEAEINNETGEAVLLWEQLRNVRDQNLGQISINVLYSIYAVILLGICTSSVWKTWGWLFRTGDVELGYGLKVVIFTILCGTLISLIALSAVALAEKGQSFEWSIRESKRIKAKRETGRTRNAEST